ncbi:MAG: methyltransferase domain-containing protein [Chitinivibrionales bacterium]|nr:methyltransferase domain-containing protein [Chitinivibrionales bacterium]
MGFYDSYQKRNVSPVGRMLNERFTRRVSRLVAAYAQKNDTIIEIGSGKGALAAALSSKYSYIGYEPGPALHKSLVQGGLKVHNEFAPPLREESDTSTAIIASHVVEHMENVGVAM